MKRAFIHNPYFRIISPLVHGVLVYFLILLVNNRIQEIAESFSNQEVYVCIALSTLCLETMRMGAIGTRKWMGRTVVIAQVLISLLLVLTVVYAGIAGYYRWVEHFSVTWSELQMFMLVYGFTTLLYQVLLISNELLIRENTRQLQTEERLREKVEADFIGFRHDINPGLLYGSLEKLLLLLHRHPDRAEEQVDLLAGIYRYQLMNRNRELVTLEEELAAAELLRQLLGTDTARIELACSNDLNRKSYVVPGAVLAAMDAMVRNTLFTADAPLSIDLYQEDDEYFVMHHRINDRLVIHEESLKTFGRLQRAYSFFSDQPFVQVRAGVDNFVKFPVIEPADEPHTTIHE
ncbi:MAG: histidine kinase [Cyclobacteriaceae bacterium]|nr:histidine kinase [Cyclobacteriaceae bacterium]